jgi:hypothetical protein
MQILQASTVNNANGTQFLQLSQDHLHGQVNGFKMNNYTPPLPQHYSTLRLSQDHLRGNTIASSRQQQTKAPELPMRNGSATMNNNSRRSIPSRIYH